MRKLILLLLPLLFVLSACNWLDKDEPLPFYISVPQPEVLTDAKTGYVSNLGVRAVWVEAGADSFGYFPTPKIFPVLPGESKNFYFYGAVSDFGQGFISQYPFWKAAQLRIDVNALDTFKFSNLRFEYFPDTLLSYDFVEQFENASVQFAPLSNSQLRIEAYNGEAHERSNSGILQFNDIQTKAELISATGLMNIPFNQPAYLELTYKSDINFTVGLKYLSNAGEGEAPLSAAITASPDKWNTIYFRLNNVIASIDNNARPTAKYLLFVRADGKGETVKILLDNIRIIHRK